MVMRMRVSCGMVRRLQDIVQCRAKSASTDLQRSQSCPRDDVRLLPLCRHVASSIHLRSVIVLVGLTMTDYVGEGCMVLPMHSVSNILKCCTARHLGHCTIFYCLGDTKALRPRITLISGLSSPCPGPLDMYMCTT